jgi:hypothetical protein
MPFGRQGQARRGEHLVPEYFAFDGQTGSALGRM